MEVFRRFIGREGLPLLCLLLAVPIVMQLKGSISFADGQSRQEAGTVSEGEVLGWVPLVSAAPVRNTKTDAMQLDIIAYGDTQPAIYWPAETPDIRTRKDGTREVYITAWHVIYEPDYPAFTFFIRTVEGRTRAEEAHND